MEVDVFASRRGLAREQVPLARFPFSVTRAAKSAWCVERWPDRDAVAGGVLRGLVTSFLPVWQYVGG